MFLIKNYEYKIHIVIFIASEINTQTNLIFS